MGRHAQTLDIALDDFITKLKRRQISGSLNLARRTTELLIHAVAWQQAPSVAGVVAGVKAVGRRLVEARPLELVVGNMVRRVLYIIREEGDALMAASSQQQQHNNMREQSEEESSEDEAADQRGGGGGSGSGSDGGAMKRFKSAVIEVIGELIDELEGVTSLITAQALEHVAPNSVVLVSGGDPTVEAFLREAAKKRRFHVIVAESAPSFGGHALARTLSDRGIETTAVSDAAACSLMSRVNLVVFGAHGYDALIFRHGMFQNEKIIHTPPRTGVVVHIFFPRCHNRGTHLARFAQGSRQRRGDRPRGPTHHCPRRKTTRGARSCARRSPRALPARTRRCGIHHE